MREDRYAVNRFLYVVGFIALWLSVGLWVLSFYSLPYLLWGYHYNVADFIYTLQYWLTEEQEYTPYAASWIMLGGMWILALIFGLISQWVSRHLDSQMLR